MAGAAATFSSAASPGVVSLFFRNDYYPSHEEYVFAIADAMRHEYEAIAAAGATVQLDCPDLAMGRHSAYAGVDLDEFRRTIAINIEAINHAVRNIPADRLRMHLCWGNYPGPHHCDVPLADIVDLVWKAKPTTVLFEGANPRHAHEWAVLAELGVPDDKVICPGVIEPQSNYIEHPELVAQRLERWATVVDPSRLMAGRRLRVLDPRRHAGHRPRRRMGEAGDDGAGLRDRVTAPVPLTVRVREDRSPLEDHGLATANRCVSTIRPYTGRTSEVRQGGSHAKQHQVRVRDAASRADLSGSRRRARRGQLR